MSSIKFTSLDKTLWESKDRDWKAANTNQAVEDEGILKFENEVASTVYRNYFLPCNLINSNNSDERRLKRCKVCLLTPGAPPLSQGCAKDACCGGPEGESQETTHHEEQGLWKLPRMRHCRICERCCVKFDHHCGMAINCIGINNYNLFVLFIATTLLHLLVSALVNSKLLFYDRGIKTLSWG